MLTRNHGILLRKAFLEKMISCWKVCITGWCNSIKDSVALLSTLRTNTFVSKPNLMSIFFGMAKVTRIKQRQLKVRHLTDAFFLLFIQYQSVRDVLNCISVHWQIIVKWAHNLVKLCRVEISTQTHFQSSSRRIIFGRHSNEQKFKI